MRRARKARSPRRARSGATPPGDAKFVATTSEWRSSPRSGSKSASFGRRPTSWTVWDGIRRGERSSLGQRKRPVRRTSDSLPASRTVSPSELRRCSMRRSDAIVDKTEKPSCSSTETNTSSRTSRPKRVAGRCASSSCWICSTSFTTSGRSGCFSRPPTSARPKPGRRARSSSCSRSTRSTSWRPFVKQRHFEGSRAKTGEPSTTPSSTCTRTRSTFTMPATSSRDFPSPPESSKARVATWCRTEWDSPALDGGSTAPRPCSSFERFAPSVTGRPTGPFISNVSVPEIIPRPSTALDHDGSRGAAPPRQPQRAAVGGPHAQDGIVKIKAPGFEANGAHLDARSELRVVVELRDGRRALRQQVVLWRGRLAIHSSVDDMVIRDEEVWGRQPARAKEEDGVAALQDLLSVLVPRHEQLGDRRRDFQSALHEGIRDHVVLVDDGLLLLGVRRWQGGRLAGRRPGDAFNGLFECAPLWQRADEAQDSAQPGQERYLAAHEALGRVQSPEAEGELHPRDLDARERGAKPRVGRQ